MFFFSLNIDELSEVFETEFGYHIVQLINRRGNEIDVEYSKKEIISKINSYFGYQLINEII